MDTTNILDWNPLTALGLFPEKEEEILWAGRPALVVPLPGTERYPSRFWITYYFTVTIFIGKSVKTLELWPGILGILAVLCLQVLPFALKKRELRNTAYVVTNKRIILRLSRYFSTKMHVLRYDDFQKSTFVMEYPGTTKGTVYLMTGKEVGFWTYDLATGEKRHHPTLEGVPGAEALAMQIEKIRRETSAKQAG